MNLFSKGNFYKIFTVAVLLFGIVAIITIQFWTHTLYGPDGYLHIRMAEFFLINRQLYNLYRDVSFGRTKDPYGILKHTFKANYGYAGKNYFGGLVAQVRQDSRFKILGEDNLGVVFKLE